MTKQIHGVPYWTNLALWWSRLAPPVRPSKADIGAYDKFLKRIINSKKQPRILILGATPEIRDLSAKHRAETTVCDINLEMIIAMGQLMKNKKASQKEIWIRASWVTGPLKHNYYDVILGDGITSNVSWREANQLWKHLTQLLKPKGVFITRICYFTSKSENNKLVNNVIKRILKKKKPSASDFSELEITLELASYNAKTGICTNNKREQMFLKYIKNFSVSPAVTKRIFQQLIKIYPLHPVKNWRTLSKTEKEKEAKKYFNIISSIPAPSLPTSGTIYLLKKK